MRHRIYSRIRHIPTGAWTDILFTGRTNEDDVIPIHPQNTINSHLEAAATIYGLPITEFEVVEVLDADPAGIISYGEDGSTTRLPGGQPMGMPQPMRPPAPEPERFIRVAQQDIQDAVDATDLLRRLKARI